MVLRRSRAAWPVQDACSLPAVPPPANNEASSSSKASSPSTYGAYDREIIQWMWRPFLSSAVKSFVGFDRETDPQDASVSRSRG